MDVEKISNLIKTKRKEKNMTQEVLACRLNVTEKAISRWETGRGTPDISLLIPLSKELDLNVSELLDGEEKQKEDNIVNVIEYEKESKKMKNKKAFTISIGIYTIFLLLYLLYLKVSYSFNSFHLSYLGHILFNLVLCILIII